MGFHTSINMFLNSFSVNYKKFLGFESFIKKKVFESLKFKMISTKNCLIMGTKNGLIMGTNNGLIMGTNNGTTIY